MLSRTLFSSSSASSITVSGASTVGIVDVTSAMVSLFWAKRLGEACA